MIRVVKRLLSGLRRFGTRAPVWKHLPNWRRCERIRQKSTVVVPSNSAAPPGAAVEAMDSIAGNTVESFRPQGSRQYWKVWATLLSRCVFVAARQELRES
jgi:hypothetical protein